MNSPSWCPICPKCGDEQSEPRMYTWDPRRTFHELGDELKRLRAIADEPATREARWWATYNAALQGCYVESGNRSIAKWSHGAAKEAADTAHGELK